MYKTIVSPKGQVVIPSPIREELHFPPGTRLGVEIRGDEVRLFSLASIVDRLHGALGPDKGEVKNFIRDRREESKNETARARHWERS